MSGTYGGDRTLGGASFAIEGRSVVQIHAEGQTFRAEDATLLLALGARPSWARHWRYIQDGLTHAPGLTAEQVVEVAARSVFDGSCSAAEAPMMARATAEPVLRTAAVRVVKDGTDETAAMHLARCRFGDIRFILASGANLPLAAAMVLACDADPEVLAQVARCHEDEGVRTVAALSLEHAAAVDDIEWFWRVSPSVKDAYEHRSGPLPGGLSLPPRRA